MITVVRFYTRLYQIFPCSRPCQFSFSRQQLVQVPKRSKQQISCRLKSRSSLAISSVQGWWTSPVERCVTLSKAYMPDRLPQYDSQSSKTYIEVNIRSHPNSYGQLVESPWPVWLSLDSPQSKWLSLECHYTAIILTIQYHGELRSSSRRLDKRVDRQWWRTGRRSASTLERAKP